MTENKACSSCSESFRLCREFLELEFSHPHSASLPTASAAPGVRITFKGSYPLCLFAGGNKDHFKTASLKHADKATMAEVSASATNGCCVPNHLSQLLAAAAGRPAINFQTLQAARPQPTPWGHACACIHFTPSSPNPEQALCCPDGTSALRLGIHSFGGFVLCPYYILMQSHTEI